MKGYIYKIKCLETNECYYGSTTNFIKRKSAHINYKNYDNRDCISSKIIDRNNYTIDIIEEIDIDNKEELLNREQYYIDNFDNINIRKSIRTIDDIRQQNRNNYYRYREEYCKKVNEYRRNNKDFVDRKVCCILCRKELLYRGLKRHIRRIHS